MTINTPHARQTLSIAALGVEETIIDAGALDRKIGVQKLPETLEECRAEFTITCPVRTDGDTRLYIRVQQIDGHRAWTSPIYLFK
jgi:hypothetical protein